jgi:putative transposase
MSRQAIYQREKRSQQRKAELEPVKSKVQAIRRFMPRLGTRKLYWLMKPELNRAGIKLGRDGLFSYLREQQMLVKPRKSYTKTTFSKHWMKKHPNLLKERKDVRPEQVLVSDITYVESDEGVHYLSLVTDAGSRRIMGHYLSRDMKADNVVKALQRAVTRCSRTESIIHHSDRGLQYCSSVYQDELRQHGMIPSMTDGYDCYQNALAERINGILKQEFLLFRCRSFEDLECLIDQSVDIYNEMRPHLSLGMKTPNEVHKKAAA